jgi:hypothetical protein
LVFPPSTKKVVVAAVATGDVDFRQFDAACGNFGVGASNLHAFLIG